MRLVERHIIGGGHRHFGQIDELAFRAKNLFNLATYTTRQEFFATGRVLTYETLYERLKDTEAYAALPAKVSQQVLRGVGSDWKSFKAARAEYGRHPEKFRARPRVPSYKDKQSGRHLLVYTIQALSRPALRYGFITPSGTIFQIPTAARGVRQVRIVPRRNHYVLEVVYEQPRYQVEVDAARVAGVDVGVDTLAAIASNQPGFVPLLVNGRPLKDINAAYNRELARLRSELPEDQKTSRRIAALTHKRNCRVENYLHQASRSMVETLAEFGIGKLVIGKNSGWKQEVNLGSKTNQNFVFIPHARLIEMLEYKAELYGIEVEVVEESYTSKCSFLDGEPVGKHETYQGRRVKRGLFRASDGRLINADVNAAANIIRKVVPDAFEADGIAGVVVRPRRVTPAVVHTPRRAGNGRVVSELAA